MSRPLRVEIAGGFFHVTSRGDGRERIFHGDGDRETFLRILGQTIERHRWICHAYCLMGNHYHLLIETPEANLSRGMRHLNGVYTQRFNAGHHRVGHVFQGRFTSVLVDRESHLLELCRYVVLNPVRAGMVDHPEDWAWSSYRGTAGSTAPPSWLTVDLILGRFGSGRDEARERYRAFVGEGLTAGSPWEALKGRVVLGDEHFVQKVEPHVRGQAESFEIPRAQRMVGRPRLAELIDAALPVRRKGLPVGAIHEAFTRFGYTQKEIAEHLGIHPATVSRLIRAQEES